jgi:biotin carboxyl carrier protein
MRIHVLVNGRPRTVSIEPVGTAFRVAVDGREREIDVVPLGSASYLLIPVGAERIRKARIEESTDRCELVVHLPDATVAVQRLRAGQSEQAAAGDPAGPETGARAVAASMPGKVVRLLVSKGDTVAARQGVVVVEAMKMENELRAPKAGRVTEVHVREGMAVEAGRILVVVE